MTSEKRFALEQKAAKALNQGPLDLYTVKTLASSVNQRKPRGTPRTNKPSRSPGGQVGKGHGSPLREVVRISALPVKTPAIDYLTAFMCLRRRHLKGLSRGRRSRSV